MAKVLIVLVMSAQAALVFIHFAQLAGIHRPAVGTDYAGADPLARSQPLCPKVTYFYALRVYKNWALSRK